MNEEINHLEYNCDTNPYPSYGKRYYGERAIISLTSWKKRIDLVETTINSLLKQCPGFHIVLVLSEEEFPKMEKELPENLMNFVNHNIIELLWVYKNYKSLKKWIFTSDKYKDTPIITADDDCIYKCNYAQDLYNKWEKDKDSIFRYVEHKPNYPQGPCTIFPPDNICHIYSKVMSELNNFKNYKEDDSIIAYIIKKYNIKLGCFKRYRPQPFIFHTTIGALHPKQRRKRFYKECFINCKEK